jgi:alpha-tubulin suppressor-like RCC1 family protein
MKPPHRMAPQSPWTALAVSLAIVLLGGSFIAADGTASTTSILPWGSNATGQLGYANPVTDLTPDLVVGLGPGSGVIATSAGGAHSLTLNSDGTVLAWGSNANGQLGDGTTTPQLLPVGVSGLGHGSGVVAIAAGGGHSLALKADGSVLAWGGNFFGQLGDGTTTQRLTLCWRTATSIRSTCQAAPSRQPGTSILPAKLSGFTGTAPASYMVS